MIKIDVYTIGLASHFIRNIYKNAAAPLRVMKPITGYLEKRCGYYLIKQNDTLKYIF
jgi:hypothetical protein